MMPLGSPGWFWTPDSHASPKNWDYWHVPPVAWKVRPFEASSKNREQDSSVIFQTLLVVPLLRQWVLGSPADIILDGAWAGMLLRSRVKQLGR